MEDNRGRGGLAGSPGRDESARNATSCGSAGRRSFGSTAAALTVVAASTFTRDWLRRNFADDVRAVCAGGHWAATCVSNSKSTSRFRPNRRTRDRIGRWSRRIDSAAEIACECRDDSAPDSPQSSRERRRRRQSAAQTADRTEPTLDRARRRREQRVCVSCGGSDRPRPATGVARAVLRRDGRRQDTPAAGDPGRVSPQLIRARGPSI